MRKFTKLFLSIVIGLLLITPINLLAKEKYVIGIYCHTFQPPWLILQNAARMRAAEISKEYGVDLSVDIQAPPTHVDIIRQMNIIDDFMAKKVDMLVAIPVTTQSFESVIRKANVANIPIGLFITDQEPPVGANVEWWLYNDDVNGGIQVGEALARELNYEGNVLLMHGVYESRWNNFRAQGIRTALNKYGIHILDEQAADWDREKGMRQMEDWIVRFGEKIDALAALNGEMALGAYGAMKASGLDFIITGWDGSVPEAEAILDHRLAYSVDMHWAEYGVQMVDLAWLTLQGKEVKPKRNILKTSLINKKYAKMLLKRTALVKNNQKPEDWDTFGLEYYKKNVLNK